MTEARADILRIVRAQARGGDIPPQGWESRRHFDDLAERFTASLTRVHGEVIRVDSYDEAVKRLGNLLDDLNAQRIVVNDEAPLRALDPVTRWPDRSWYLVGQHDRAALRAFCATADVGLSSASAALAETGSLVVTSGPGLSRQATLLPPIHIALVPTSTLVTDIFPWVQARPSPVPAALTLITGPSKNADIEQILAIGVHGPKRFIVILYRD